MVVGFGFGVVVTTTGGKYVGTGVGFGVGFVVGLGVVGLVVGLGVVGFAVDTTFF